LVSGKLEFQVTASNITKRYSGQAGSAVFKKSPCWKKEVSTELVLQILRLQLSSNVVPNHKIDVLLK
jgi:hypothetical protein